MNLKLKKLTIATAAAFAMGAAGQAQSSDLLFPYVVVSETVTTIVSVINTGDIGENLAHRLHYRLWYKNGPNAENNLARCEEVNLVLPTSYNDIQTIDLGDRIDNYRGVMFDDPSVNNNWQAAQFPYSLAGNLDLPVRGYLIVDDQIVPNPQDSEEILLQGEAMIFEYGSGAAWGYQAGAVYSDDEGGDFRDRDPEDGVGVSFTDGAPATANVAIMPFDEVTTRFFVTPLVEDMRTGNNFFAPGEEARARLTFGAAGETAVFDRDENPISGNVNQEVVCVGAVDAGQMLSQGARNLFSPTGGWGPLNVQGRIIEDGLFNVREDSVGAAVIKLDFNDGSSSFAGASMGVFNNAFLLRGVDQ